MADSAKASLPEGWTARDPPSTTGTSVAALPDDRTTGCWNTAA